MLSHANYRSNDYLDDNDDPIEDSDNASINNNNIQLKSNNTNNNVSISINNNISGRNVNNPTNEKNNNNSNIINESDFLSSIQWNNKRNDPPINSFNSILNKSPKIPNKNVNSISKGNNPSI